MTEQELLDKGYSPIHVIPFYLCEARLYKLEGGEHKWYMRRILNEQS